MLALCFIAQFPVSLVALSREGLTDTLSQALGISHQLGQVLKMSTRSWQRIWPSVLLVRAFSRGPSGRLQEDSLHMSGRVNGVNGF